MTLEFRKTVKADYPDVITPDAVRALEALARFDIKRKALMSARIERRADRARQHQRIGFLDPDSARSAAHRSRSATPATATSSAARFRTICVGNGSRAPVRRRGPAPRSRSGFATSRMRC